ncbi:helix-turn-helix transcriptional regulator [Protaetiibacter intestinalis]|uniref:helix-turn-helix transcriptional regulator n=1 Tax=Protaetiibacter intestinalis TaxID=2419774 RepID=UPI001D0388DA|nr:helix-turn-helix transcriptional regulator [Protaetiibacter intestinalis]
MAVLGANILCGTQPIGSLVATVLYLDRDYLVDQVFWQHAGHMIDRLDASQLLADFYGEPIQIFRFSEELVAILGLRLDALVDLGQRARGLLFYRAQALLSEVLDVVAPQVHVAKRQITPAQRHTPALKERWARLPRPLREEARVAAAKLRGSPSYRWTLANLAREVYLSPAQLSRIFVEAHGRTPLAYLRVIRTERMALLLRTTGISVQQAAREVGWSSRSYAARVFQQHLGVSPRQYRKRTSQSILQFPDV